jgi:hypothetical protein
MAHSDHLTLERYRNLGWAIYEGPNGWVAVEEACYESHPCQHWVATPTDCRMRIAPAIGALIRATGIARHYKNHEHFNPGHYQ